MDCLSSHFSSLKSGGILGGTERRRGVCFNEFHSSGKKQGNEVFNLIAVEELLDYGCHPFWSPISDFS